LKSTFSGLQRNRGQYGSSLSSLPITRLATLAIVTSQICEIPHWASI